MLTLSCDATCGHCADGHYTYCADCHGPDDEHEREAMWALTLAPNPLITGAIMPASRQIRTPRAHYMGCTEQVSTPMVGGAS